MAMVCQCDLCGKNIKEANRWCVDDRIFTTAFVGKIHPALIKYDICKTCYDYLLDCLKNAKEIIQKEKKE